MREQLRFHLEYASPGRRIAPPSRPGDAWLRDVPFVLAALSVVTALLYVVAFAAHWFIAALIY